MLIVVLCKTQCLSLFACNTNHPHAPHPLYTPSLPPYTLACDHPAPRRAVVWARFKYISAPATLFGIIKYNFERPTKRPETQVDYLHKIRRKGRLGYSRFPPTPCRVGHVYLSALFGDRSPNFFLPSEAPPPRLRSFFKIHSCPPSLIFSNYGRFWANLIRFGCTRSAPTIRPRFRDRCADRS